MAEPTSLNRKSDDLVSQALKSVSEMKKMKKAAIVALVTILTSAAVSADSSLIVTSTNESAVNVLSTGINQGLLSFLESIWQAIYGLGGIIWPSQPWGGLAILAVVISLFFFEVRINWKELNRWLS